MSHNASYAPPQNCLVTAEGYHLKMAQPTPHYAEAVYVEPGRCFRFVHSGVGHAAHRPDPVIGRGQFVDGKGKRWKVDACANHFGELTSATRGRRRDE